MWTEIDSPTPGGGDRAAPNRTTLLQKVLELTRTIRLLAYEADWNAIEQQDRERKALLAELYPGQSDNAPSLAEERQALEQLVAMNEEILGLARAAREEVGAELTNFALNRGAAKAYHAHSV
jgi:hypothetical protein